METKIIELLDGILGELQKLNANIQAAQSRDYQQEAMQMVGNIMQMVSGIGGRNGQ